MTPEELGRFKNGLDDLISRFKRCIELKESYIRLMLKNVKMENFGCLWGNYLVGGHRDNWSIKGDIGDMAANPFDKPEEIVSWSVEDKEGKSKVIEKERQAQITEIIKKHIASKKG